MPAVEKDGVKMVKRKIVCRLFFREIGVCALAAAVRVKGFFDVESNSATNEAVQMIFRLELDSSWRIQDVDMDSTLISILFFRQIVFVVMEISRNSRNPLLIKGQFS
jgi:hypothetical protein